MTLIQLPRFGKKKPRPAAGPPRIMGYCASNIGLGHWGRLASVLAEIKRRRPETDIIVATDAPDEALAQAAELAFLRLPRFAFREGTAFKEAPLNLRIEPRELRDLRAQVLLAAGKSFAPDVLLADTNPHGKRDELLPLLKWMHDKGEGRSCLMMRDIPCPPGEEFKLNGSDAARHASLYDAMLIAGDAGFFDPAREYGWPAEVRAKSRMAGFIMPRVAALNRRQALAPWPGLDPGGPLIVAGCGGGWRSGQVIAPLLDGLELYRERSNPAVQLLAMAGPAADEVEVNALAKRGESMRGAVIERYSSGFPSALMRADLAILQAGSTAFQLIEGDAPIVLMPRDYKSREQAERAERLARLPGIKLAGERTGAEDVAGWIAWGLETPRRRRATGWGFNGVDNAADAVEALLPRV